MRVWEVRSLCIDLLDLKLSSQNIVGSGDSCLATKSFHTVLSLAARPASTTESSPTRSQLVSMLSSQRIGGLSRGRLPGMIPSKVILGYLNEGILLTCPKYESCFARTLLTMEIWKFSDSLMAVFLTLSNLVTPRILRRQAISNTSSRCSSFFFNVQVSQLKVAMERTRTLYSSSLVWVEIGWWRFVTVV